MTPSACLSPGMMLELWEHGAGWHPIDQALLVLRCAEPNGGRNEDLSDWSIGHRDRRLLEIRRDTFGDRIGGYADCPACGSGLEFELSCDALLKSAENISERPIVVKEPGVAWELRAPTSRDLAAALAAPDTERARQELLARCVRETEGNGPETGLSPNSSHAQLIERLAAEDHLAEILLDLRCQACGHACQYLFDIATFLWDEIRARSRRLLQEIDLLARTYGWTERDILHLTNARRNWYVQMALS